MILIAKRISFPFKWIERLLQALNNRNSTVSSVESVASRASNLIERNDVNDEDSAPTEMKPEILDPPQKKKETIKVKPYLRRNLLISLFVSSNLKFDLDIFTINLNIYYVNMTFLCNIRAFSVSNLEQSVFLEIIP